MTSVDQLDLTVMGKYAPETISTWDESKVKQWLLDIGMDQFATKFYGKYLDFESLDLNYLE